MIKNNSLLILFIFFFSKLTFAKELSCKSIFNDQVKLSDSAKIPIQFQLELSQLPNTKAYLEFISSTVVSMDTKNINFTKYHQMALELSNLGVDKLTVTIIQKKIAEILKNYIKQEMSLSTNSYDRKRIILKFHTSALKTAIEALQLIKADVEQWKNFITSEAQRVASENGDSEYGFRSTAGFLVRSLSNEQKSNLLQFIGEQYNIKKNSYLIAIANIILDPKAIYQEMKKSGKSELDFYKAYFNLFQNAVFKNGNRGKYPFHVVTDLIKAINKVAFDTKRLITFDEDHIYIFGSVPNGYAKPESDIDIFQNGFTLYSVQIEQAVLPLLKTYGLNWKIEEDLAQKKYAPENFPGENNVFSYFLYKNKIQIRMYFDRLRVDEDGNKVNIIQPLIVDISEDFFNE